MVSLFDTTELIYLQRHSRPGNGLPSSNNFLAFNSAIFNQYAFKLCICYSAEFLAMP